MARNLTPKCKVCRRLGFSVCSKGQRASTSKCALVKRNYVPGMHGPKQGPASRARMTDYGKQLKEKQKAKYFYRIMEKQFYNYFVKAAKSQSSTSFVLARSLEIRFDNVVYRLGMTTSRDQARQFVSHGHLLVNNKKVDIPSYELKEGDVITVKDKSKKFIGDVVRECNVTDTPDWLMFEPKEIKGQVYRLPEEKDWENGIDMTLIVEFYSK